MGMYLRETKRKNKNGSTVTYYQLAENIWNKDKKYPTAKVIHNFGRAEHLDKESLKRLARSILRVCQGVDLVMDDPDPNLQILSSTTYGPVALLDGLWQKLGMQKLLGKLLEQKDYSTPLERAIFAMVMNRCLAPSSKRDSLRWMQEEIFFPESKNIELQHLYRAMDFLNEHQSEVEREIYFSTANLLNLDVDLIFYDTTSIFWETEVEDEDQDGESGLRKRGYSKDSRPDAPQIIVGLAVTRDGYPVRSWVFSGNTTDTSTISQVKKDLSAWRLNRVIFVGDRGMISEENLAELSRGGGRYILGVRLRSGNEVEEVLARRGRFKEVAGNLRVKEVWYPDKDAGERRRRYIVCHNPEEEKRKKYKREEIIKELEAELALLNKSDKNHPKKACKLLSSRRFGPYLEQLKSGRLKIDKKKILSEEKRDGKYVLITNDDTLSPEDVALGYKQLLRVESCFRDLKSDIRIRPMFHHAPHRIKAHVSLCMIALLLEHMAENACGDTWRNVRNQLSKQKMVQFFSRKKTVIQTTKPTPQTRNIFNSLEIKLPPTIHSITDTSKKT
jgi:transposase